MIKKKRLFFSLLKLFLFILCFFLLQLSGIIPFFFSLHFSFCSLKILFFRFLFSKISLPHSFNMFSSFFCISHLNSPYSLLLFLYFSPTLSCDFNSFSQVISLFSFNTDYHFSSFSFKFFTLRIFCFLFSVAFFHIFPSLLL